MGSLLRGETFPAKKRQMFINVFKKIPQRILWKWEGDELPGKPPNVMISKWMPQRDILGTYKYFATHLIDKYVCLHLTMYSENIEKKIRNNIEYVIIRHNRK